VQDHLVQLTGSRSVPKVYIGGELVGGCDDTMGKAKNASLFEPYI
jgi:glutaredoxin